MGKEFDEILEAMNKLNERLEKFGVENKDDLEKQFADIPKDAEVTKKIDNNLQSEYKVRGNSVSILLMLRYLEKHICEEIGIDKKDVDEIITRWELVEKIVEECD